MFLKAAYQGVEPRSLHGGSALTLSYYAFQGFLKGNPVKPSGGIMLHMHFKCGGCCRLPHIPDT